METMLLGTIALVGITGILYFFIRQKKSRLSIPGPKGWPLVGNAFQMDPDRPHITLSSWAETYGDIFAISNFGRPVVVCNSFDAIWEVYVTKSNAFAGRPQMFPLAYIHEGKDVVISDYSPEWVRRKKVLLTSIQRYSINKWEDTVMDIIQELLQDLHEMDGKDVDPMETLQFALANILSLTLFGSRFEKNDPEFKELLYLNDEILKIAAPSFIFFLLDTFPFLKDFPVHSCRRLDWFVDRFNRTWLPNQLRKRQEVYDPEDPTCVLDGLMKQQEEDIASDTLGAIQKGNVIFMCHNFFLAGMNTSTSTIYSVIALLTNYPEIQARAQEEVGGWLKGRPPRYSDKDSMPYIQALLEETLRYAVILPLSHPHKATEDTSLFGHFIPKGAEVWPNIWHLCHDENVWGDPWTFRPERFLDINGNFFPTDHPLRKRVLTFGAGRRVCAGQLMGKTRLFLILTSLLQTFTFLPNSEGAMPKYDPRTYPTYGTLQPERYTLRMVPRHA